MPERQNSDGAAALNAVALLDDAYLCRTVVLLSPTDVLTLSFLFLAIGLVAVAMAGCP